MNQMNAFIFKVLTHLLPNNLVEDWDWPRMTVCRFSSPFDSIGGLWWTVWPKKNPNKLAYFLDFDSKLKSRNCITKTINLLWSLALTAFHSFLLSTMRPTFWCSLFILQLRSLSTCFHPCPPGGWSRLCSSFRRACSALPSSVFKRARHGHKLNNVQLIFQDKKVHDILKGKILSSFDSRGQCEYSSPWKNHFWKHFSTYIFVGMLRNSAKLQQTGLKDRYLKTHFCTHWS